MKKVLVIQHVEFEGPGRFLHLFDALDYKVTYCKLWEEALPDIDNFDLFLVMGGPMSVNDVDQYPWLHKEKKYINDVINSGKKIIGICLGAQLIASALGEAVYLADEPEIGWYPVRLEKDRSPFVFHWHGETFDLPKGAKLLASSAICENQIFTYGENVMAFQCHLELDKNALEAMLNNCRNDLSDDRYVMSEINIMEGYALYGERAWSEMKKIVNHFFSPQHQNN